MFALATIASALAVPAAVLPPALLYVAEDTVQAALAPPAPRMRDRRPDNDACVETAPPSGSAPARDCDADEQAPTDTPQPLALLVGI